jgi:hypothetical protein
MWQILLMASSIITGAAIGWLMPWLDKIAYIYILHPEAQVSQYVKYQIQKRQWRQAWASLSVRGQEFDKLTTRGILFQLAWVVLAFFAVTSSAGWFGKALVLAVGARLLLEQWREYFADREKLKQKLLWQVKKDWSESELKFYLIGLTLTVAWLLRLAI